MAKTTRENRAKPIKSTAKGWSSLTWDDLDHWTGSRSVSRGRTYHEQGRVKDLAISPEGRLLATVVGGERYTTSVWLQAKKKRAKALQSQCTCPVGYDGCKHAVAVVAEYLQAIADEKPVPAAAEDDPRWAKLSAGKEDWDDDSWEEQDEDEDGDDAKDVEEQPTPQFSKRSRGGRMNWDEKIRQYIRDKSQDELVALVLGLVERFPELREEFQERIALGEGNVQRLVAQARHELESVSSEIGWQNSWSDEGHTPNYSRFRHRLERLSELGHADAVVRLGREFIERAMRQVGESHDEGETVTAVAECLPVIFEAVEKSSLPAADKILFAIDARLADDYDVVGEEVNSILDAKWQQADWSAAADALQDRLKAVSVDKSDGSGRDYQRNRVSDWLLTALENAGREDELLSIYETEARATASYERLVRFLIRKRKLGDAQRWAKEGIEKTVEKFPGIAWTLAGMLKDVAQRRKQWDVAAAYTAARFFDQPGLRSLNELVAEAKKAKCAKQVQSEAIRFLETGVPPMMQEPSPKGGAALRIDPAWPLPVPEYLVPLLRRPRRGPGPHPQPPHYDVLMDLAIAEKRPEEVLHWYDQMREGRTRHVGTWDWAGSSHADRVAEAVAKSHPERALAIYQDRLKANLGEANPRLYEAAGHYLRKMRPVLKSLGREADWHALVAGIREKYRNRPLFMNVLDKLEGRTVLESQKIRRRR